MIEFDDVQDLVSPVVIAAFEGWNDAADAASGLVDHLIEEWKAEVIGAIDPEEFYDFQVNRPIIATDHNGHRRLTWPTTRIAVARPAELDRDAVLRRHTEADRAGLWTLQTSIFPENRASLALHQDLPQPVSPNQMRILHIEIQGQVSDSSSANYQP